MRIKSKTIFSSSSLPINGENEIKKTSYWREILLSRARDKEKRNLSEQARKQVKDAAGVELTSEEKGLEEAVKSHANKVESNKQAVEDMVSNSNRILLKVSSVFPWDFFPTSIVIEETRLTIIHRQLLSSQVHSVDIKNISNVFIDSGILFAQLIVVSDTFAQNQIVINRLWKNDAIFMRRIIEGLRMFIGKEIDTTGYKIEELISKLKELSTTGIIM